MKDYMKYIVAMFVAYLIFTSFGNDSGRYEIISSDGQQRKDVFLLDTKTGNTWIYNGSWNAISTNKYR